jgi:hypothetical protein
MGDIAEGNEAEETEHKSTTSPIEAATATVTGPISANRTEDMNLISLSQIQGLHISSSPVPPSSSFATLPILLPILPLPPYPSVGTNNSTITTVNSATHPRISPPLACILRRTRTHEQVRSPPSDPSNAQNPLVNHQIHGVGLPQVLGFFGLGSFAGGGGSQYAGSAIPGHPLFVSNFVRLAGGPTMKAM